MSDCSKVRFLEVFLSSILSYVTLAHILLSLSLVVSLITPWESERGQDQTRKKHDQRKTEVLLVLNRSFNVRGDSFEKATQHPSVCEVFFQPCNELLDFYVRMTSFWLFITHCLG